MPRAWVVTDLVAANLLSDMVQGLDDAQTKLLALLILCDSDILDVTNLTQAVNTVVGLVSYAVSPFLSCSFL